VVDDKDYDAFMPDHSPVPDGRAAGAAMQYYNVQVPRSPRQGGSNAGMQVDWAYFWPGQERIKLTEKLTKGDLMSFQSFVRVHGGCKCKKYFGIQ
jgi:hypothetical protein